MQVLASHAAANEAALPALEALLTELGMAHTRAGHTVRAELKLGGVKYGTAFFVTAPLMFTLDEGRRSDEDPDYDVAGLSPERRSRRFQYTFWEYQLDLFEPEIAKPDHGELHLFVVGDADYLYRTLDVSRRYLVENDTRYARKRAVTLEKLPCMLQSPFAGILKANEEMPRVDLSAEFSYLPRNAKEPAHALMRAGSELAQREDVLERMRDVGVQQRMEVLLYRVMGGEYRFIWADEGVEVARVGDKRGTPVEFASSGEQAAVAFAYFLATLPEVTPETTLRIGGDVLNRLSLLWLLGAMEVLRELVLATGAHLQLQMVKSDSRALAKQRFKPVAQVTEHMPRFD